MKLNEKSVVLVGLMGVGKSRIGIELAKYLKMPFFDSDSEIERAAGLTVQEIFQKFGEHEFRQGEKKVIIRLLSGQPIVLATGGGAFMQEDVRKTTKEKAISIWLKASLETLLERTSRNQKRPLLMGVDREEKLKELMLARNPIYETADIAMDTDGFSPRDMARSIVAELEKR